MPNAKLKLTKSAVEKHCAPPEPGETNTRGKPTDSLVYWDTELKGFGLQVRRSGRRTWFVKKDIRGNTRQVRIGQYPAWTPEMARKRAMELIVEMDSGVDPNARARGERARGTTLDEAIGWHQTAMRAKRCAERSVATIREESERTAFDAQVTVEGIADRGGLLVTLCCTSPRTPKRSPTSSSQTPPISHRS